MTKKAIKKAWNFGTTLVVTIFFLVLASAMASGALVFQGWLSFIPSWVAIVVGWIFIVLILLNLAMSIWNFFTK